LQVGCKWVADLLLVDTDMYKKVLLLLLSL
jgi:hypothetical protein